MPDTKYTNRAGMGRWKAIAKTVLPLMALFIGFSSYKMLVSNRPTPPSHVKREAVHPVRTKLIHLASHQPALKLYGEIRAGRKVELRALVAGKVQKTGSRFREGARVKKGDLLLLIDPFTYQGTVTEAQAKIDETRARLSEIKAQVKSEKDSILFSREQLKLSQRDMKRARKLVRKGSVTRQGADVREMAVSQRRQSLQGKRANLLILQAKARQQLAALKSLEWRLRLAKRNLQDTALRAPFDGYLGAPNANMGKLLNVNDKVAVLLDRNWMDVAFTLSDQQYGRLVASNKGEKGQEGLIGRTVKVTWKLGERRVVYKAVVERIGATISSETGGVAVYARLLNPTSPLPVREGAFVDVEVPDRLYQNVVKLPQSALYQRSKIYVVGDDHRLQERLVTLRAIDGEAVLVDGDVREGEHVVITRMSLIGGGMKVRDLSAKKRQNKPSPATPASALQGTGEAQNSDKPAQLGKSAKNRRETRWQPTLGEMTKGGEMIKGGELTARGELIKDRAVIRTRAGG